MLYHKTYFLREEENIYSWEPKYSVYTETQTVDGETTEVKLVLIKMGGCRLF